MKIRTLGLLAALLMLCASTSCTDEEAATKALRVAGYRDVHLTGHSWFSCSKDDGTSTGFEAFGPTGEPVTGAVCCGYWSWSKGCTIRTR